MARRQKPAGQENWTWREIDAGRRMSKSEKRTRNTMEALGAEYHSNGSLKQHSPESLAFAIVLVVITFVGLAFYAMTR